MKRNQLYEENIPGRENSNINIKVMSPSIYL